MYVMYVMRSQRPYVKGNPIYEACYRDGIRQYQDACGPPLVCKWRQMRGPGRWRPALHSPTIARWFDSPQLSDVMRFASAPLLLCAVGLVPGAMLVKHLQLDKTAQA